MKVKDLDHYIYDEVKAIFFSGKCLPKICFKFCSFLKRQKIIPKFIFLKLTFYKGSLSCLIFQSYD